MQIKHIIAQQATSDGDGVRIKRVADFNAAQLDPFLMIDELRSDDEKDYIGGFPPHPHRGMETFTYIRKGGFEHRDQLGNREAIKAHGTQWMSTGKGVLHSEMPLADAKDGMHGFQIWVNMAAKDKLRAPLYQDSNDTGNPELTAENGAVLRALAGTWTAGGETIVAPITNLSADAMIADAELPANSKIEFGHIDRELLMVLVYEGNLGHKDARQGRMLVLDANEPLILETEDSAANVLVFAGNPLREPVVHYGPFVMNTQQQIHDAIRDYQNGKFGHIS